MLGGGLMCDQKRCMLPLRLRSPYPEILTIGLKSEALNANSMEGRMFTSSGQRPRIYARAVSEPRPNFATRRRTRAQSCSTSLILGCGCASNRAGLFKAPTLPAAQIRQVLLGSALLLAFAPSLAARDPVEPVPSRVEVNYRMTIAGIPVVAGLAVFQHDGKTYSVVMESRTIGIAALYRLHIRSEARGYVQAKGLRPLSYVETRNGRFTRGASFDWTAGQVQLVDGDKKQTVQLRPNTWDAATLACAFSFSRPDGKDLQLYMTDGRRVTEYKYSVLGREKLTTPLGELDTVHVKKIQEDGDKRAFDAWLAIDRHFLVARARATEKDGTVFDWTVQSVNFAL